MTTALNWTPPTAHRGHLQLMPDPTCTAELGHALGVLDRLEREPVEVRAEPTVERDGLALARAARLAAEVEAQMADYHRGELARHEVRRARYLEIAEGAERVILA